jgi:hypothetical protein
MIPESETDHNLPSHLKTKPKFNSEREAHFLDFFPDKCNTISEWLWGSVYMDSEKVPVQISNAWSLHGFSDTPTIDAICRSKRESLSITKSLPDRVRFRQFRVRDPARRFDSPRKVSFILGLCRFCSKIRELGEKERQAWLGQQLEEIDPGISVWTWEIEEFFVEFMSKISLLNGKNMAKWWLHEKEKDICRPRYVHKFLGISGCGDIFH